MPNNIDLVTATDLERQIFEKEEIRVVIRSNKNDKFKPYQYDRKAAASTSVTDWYNTRLKPLLDQDSQKYEAEIIDGNGITPHGRTKMETLRNSYAGK